MTNGEGFSTNGNVWIADSVALENVTNSLKGMSDLEPCDGFIKVGDGTKLKVWYKGVFTGVLKVHLGRI